MISLSSYRDFWNGVGERFPDLAGAVSTRYYADNGEDAVIMWRTTAPA